MHAGGAVLGPGAGERVVPREAYYQGQAGAPASPRHSAHSAVPKAAASTSQRDGRAFRTVRAAPLMVPTVREVLPLREIPEQVRPGSRTSSPPCPGLPGRPRAGTQQACDPSSVRDTPVRHFKQSVRSSSGSPGETAPGDARLCHTPHGACQLGPIVTLSSASVCREPVLPGRGPLWHSLPERPRPAPAARPLT